MARDRAARVARVAPGVAILVLVALLAGAVGRTICWAAPDDAGYAQFGYYTRFEPSGIARIAQTDRFVVINDKEDNPPLSVFAGQPTSGKLTEQSRFAFGPTNRPATVRKLEAITASRRDPRLFYAITAFDRPESDYRRLVRFRLDEEDRLTSVKIMRLCDPGETIGALLGAKWSKVEALALEPDEDRLLLGVRAVGEDYEHPQYRVIVLEYDLHALQEQPGLWVNIDLTDTLGRPEGISSLEFSPSGENLLLATSFEDESITVPTDQVGGHLWAFPSEGPWTRDSAAWDEDKCAVAVSHKPEGVAPLSETEFVVVFDDDNDRKSACGEPGKFTLAMNEAVFAVVTRDPDTGRLRLRELGAP